MGPACSVCVAHADNGLGAEWFRASAKRRSASKWRGARRVLRRTPLIPISRPVSRVLYGTPQAACVTTIHLRRRLPGAFSNQPERQIRTDPGLLPRRSYSVLLPVGFAVPPALPQTRCALTAPFHPYLPEVRTCGGRFVLCGTVPEAARPRRTLSGTVCPWSPDFPPRPPFGDCRSGRPAD